MGHAVRPCFSSGGCAFSVESGLEPNKTVPNPVCASSLDRKPRGQEGRPTATHHHGYPHCTPQAAHGRMAWSRLDAHTGLGTVLIGSKPLSTLNAQPPELKLCFKAWTQGASV